MIDTKALREKVLDLAIRGKLVPQDPTDEPASVLLERIREQKKQMVKEGKLKAKDIKDDSIIFVGDDNLHYEKFADGKVECIEDEIPFELPNGWAWCRLSMVGTTNIGLTYKPTEVKETGTIVLRSCNIKNGKMDFADLVRVQADIRENQYIYENDILICARNGSRSLVGKCAIMKGLTEVASFGAFMAVFRSICNEYVYYYFNTSLFRSSFDNDDSKQINQVTQAILRDTLIPLPPIAEQTRIVTKLYETLSLVDFINDGTEQIETIITNVKEKILDLAIRGKLLPQDPDDEPASVLLERIRAEKEELIKAGKIKRDKKESIIFKGEDNSYYEKIGDSNSCIDDQTPYEIPQSWNWARISTIGAINPRNYLSDHTTVSFVPMPLIHDGYSNAHTFDTKNWKDVKKGFTHFAENDVGVAKITPCFENKKSVVFKNLCNGFGAGTTELHIIRTFDNAVNPEYLLWCLKTDSFISSGINAFSGAVGQKRIGKEFISDYLVPIPPRKEQDRIVKKINELFSLISHIEKSLS